MTKVQHLRHQCQHCGSDTKLVETIIDDEFIWDDTSKQYQPHQYTDCFEHTGKERCARCQQDWTGV